MGDTSWIDDRLVGVGAPLIIDGGMGTELEKSGVPMNGVCWSGQAVLDAPDTVRKIHATFIGSGADVIITNTFASGRHVLAPAEMANRVRDINVNAVRLAQEAIADAATGPVAIAGSLCEWATSRGDGTRTQLNAIADAMQEQATLLAEAGVNLIAIEMAQDKELSPLAVDAAVTTGLPVWLGLSCKRGEGHTHLTAFDDPDSDFETIAKTVIYHAKQTGNVTLINIMHTPVPDVPEAIEIVKRHWDGPIGVYPESGFFTMPHWNFVDIISPDDLVAAARSWVDDHGVRLLGGCCGLSPDHIAALRRAFQPTDA